MLTKDKQLGSIGGYILAILLFGGLFTISSRLVPIYMNHNTISKILDDMHLETDLLSKTDRQLIQLINKRLRLNNIRDFPIDEYVEFDRRGNRINIILEYEFRVPMIFNLDLIASFNKEIELRD